MKGGKHQKAESDELEEKDVNVENKGHWELGEESDKVKNNATGCVSRAKWCGKEDWILLLCKAAGKHLHIPNQTAFFQMVAGLLRSIFPQSNEKNADACQRRLKNIGREDEVAEILDEIRAADETKTSLDFAALVELLMTRREGPVDMQRYSLTEVEAQYNLVLPGKRVNVFSNPISILDIRASVLNALITSCMCSEENALRACKQHFPDQMIKEGLSKLRGNGLITPKAHCNITKMIDSDDYTPMSNTPFKPSAEFNHTFICRYQGDIYQQVTNNERAYLK